MSDYLRRGALAGVAAGLMMAVVLLALGEQTISDAIALEESAAVAPGDEDPPFSRPEQLLGGAAGVLVFGAALGAIFSVVFAAVRHRLAARDDWRRSVHLAAVGFVAVFLVPWLKYPANPPAVGDPDTIGRRTALYVVMLAWSVISAWGAWRVLRWLRARAAAEPLQLTGAAVAWAAAVVAGWVLLPGSPDAVTAPAALVWRFRLATLAGSAALWAALGATFGWLTLRGRSSVSTQGVRGTPVA